MGFQTDLVDTRLFWWWLDADKFEECEMCGHIGPREDFRKEVEPDTWMASAYCQDCNYRREVLQFFKRQPISIRQVLKAAHASCSECGSTLNLDVDHVIPIQLGGGYPEDNLQVVCRACHLRKDRAILKVHAHLEGVTRNEDA